MCLIIFGLNLFAAVILTYQREAVLSKSLARLNNLPYLNKVVVIWNSPEKPSEYLTLPKLHVPTVVSTNEFLFSTSSTLQWNILL